MRTSLALAAMLIFSASVEAAEVQTCFVPGQDCAALVASTVASAQNRVLVQAYGFTSRPIVAALVDAQRRGVQVRVILDHSDVCWSKAKDAPKAECGNSSAGTAALLAGLGIKVLIDTTPAIAHNKVMVIDADRVVTGSFNFTEAAQHRNAENLVVITDPVVNGAYAANWQSRAEASEDYKP